MAWILLTKWRDVLSSQAARSFSDRRCVEEVVNPREERHRRSESCGSEIFESRRASEQTTVDGRMKSWAGSGERRDEYQKQQRQRTGKQNDGYLDRERKAFVMARLGDRNTSKLQEHQVREDPTVTNSQELRHLFMATYQLTRAECAFTDGGTRSSSSSELRRIQATCDRQSSVSDSHD